MLSSNAEVTPIPRINVLGVGISILNLELAQNVCLDAVARPSFQGYVTITGVHGVMESQKDDELKRIHNRSFLSTPDGMPMVWLGQWEGATTMDRVYGPDLMLAITEGGLTKGAKHYYYGGKPEVVATLREEVEERFPGVQIVGEESPPFRRPTEDDLNELYERLQILRPHFFWVGLGTPKQEAFMADFLARYPNLTKDWDQGILFLGVGAAFDFHAKFIKQAPNWMQRNGLEWFFRLCAEPSRLWRRYSINNTLFIAKILPAMIGLKSYKILR